MAKVILKIDGKNKTFVKDKLNLGAMKAQAEFEKELQNGFGIMGELQTLYRKNRSILMKIEKVESKIADTDDEEEVEKLYQELDELEQTEEYKEFLNKSEELNQQAQEEDSGEDFEMYDEFANLLVRVFDNQFTVDEVFDGLEVENSLADTYSKIFAGNDAGKSKKKATTTKTKQQTT
ncbi:hypothetical protein AB4M78_08690 [Staphylococcus pasteuri]|uniref:phage tail assembly chaperone G n=1 Tax=Staphylococcus pasteuri TaxID=45972 RepID=UPI0034C6480A